MKTLYQPAVKNLRTGWDRRQEDKERSRDLNFLAYGFLSLCEQHPEIAKQRPELLETAKRNI